MADAVVSTPMILKEIIGTAGSTFNTSSTGSNIPHSSTDEGGTSTTSTDSRINIHRGEKDDSTHRSTIQQPSQQQQAQLAHREYCRTSNLASYLTSTTSTLSPPE